MTEPRRALVTGGGQGIGKAIVERLTASGTRCTVFDIDDRGSSDVKESTSQIGLPASFVVADVSDPVAVRRAVRQEVDTRGPFDVVVTSAGVALHGPSIDVDPQAWQRVFDVNVNGTFWPIREAARALIDAGRPGSFVLVGSISGEVANAPQAQSAYNASKAAIHVLAKCLAIEWAPMGIRVNAVAPGFVGTALTRNGVDPAWIAEWERRTPQGRMGTPEEIAELVEFLASDRASYMTGSVVAVDGGYLAW